VLELAARFALGAAVAIATTPAGVSGAVFLLPVQVSLLGTPSPAVTPTNLLYNLFATPAALAGSRGEGPGARRLAALLALGSAPGAMVGAVVRVELLAARRPFLAVAAAVLLPLGTWLLLSRPRPSQAHARWPRPRTLTSLAFAVGVVGGVYGVGGGSLLAPLLLLLGVPMLVLAPAALASTLAASVAGVAAFSLLALHNDGAVAPDWSVGIPLGLGGVVGGLAGARLAGRVPEAALRRLLGAVLVAAALRYGWLAVAAG
jgi:uncharacterized protein